MSSAEASLHLMLRSLKLPSFVAQHEEISAQAERHGWTFSQALRQLCELEMHDRRERLFERLKRASGLPSDKTLATLEQKKLPANVRRQLGMCQRV